LRLGGVNGSLVWSVNEGVLLREWKGFHAGKACNGIGKGWALRDAKKIPIFDTFIFFGFVTYIL
jgi:hypothetical protein